MKWQNWTLLLLFEAIQARPMGNQPSTLAFAVHLASRPNQVEPLHPRQSSEPAKSTSQAQLESKTSKVSDPDRNVAIEGVLDALAKQISEKQVKQIRARFLNGESLYYALGRTLAFKVRLRIGQVDSKKVEQNEHVKMYEELAIKIGAMSREEIEQRKQEVQISRVANFKQTYNAKHGKEEDDEALLGQKQKEAFAKGHRTNKVQSADVYEHDRDFARTNDIIDDGIRAQRSVARNHKESTHTPVNKIRDKQAFDAPVKSRMIEVTPNEGEGAGIKIHMHKTMESMKKRYLDGFSISKVFGDETSAEVRMRRQDVGLPIGQRDMADHLDNLAATIGLATKEQLAQRRRERLQKAINGRIAGAHRKRLARELERSSNKRARESGIDGATNSIQKSGSMKQHTASTSSAASLSPSILAAHNRTPHPSSALYDRLMRTSVPLSRHQLVPKPPPRREQPVIDYWHHFDHSAHRTMYIEPTTPDPPSND